jgi:hypothetical protein
LESPCGIIKKNPEKKGKEKGRKGGGQCNVSYPSMIPMGKKCTEERSHQG